MYQIEFILFQFGHCLGFNFDVFKVADVHNLSYLLAYNLSKVGDLPDERYSQHQYECDHD